VNHHFSAHGFGWIVDRIGRCGPLQNPLPRTNAALGFNVCSAGSPPRAWARRQWARTCGKAQVVNQDVVARVQTIKAVNNPLMGSPRLGGEQEEAEDLRGHTTTRPR
jgi:hypothetical protein